MKLRGIKAARVKAGYTQGEMADKLGMTVNAYRHREWGEVSFSPDQMIEVAEILHLDLTQFNDFLFCGKLPAGTIDAKSF